MRARAEEAEMMLRPRDEWTKVHVLYDLICERWDMLQPLDEISTDGDGNVGVARPQRRAGKG